MWDPQQLTILQASTADHKDSFTGSLSYKESGRLPGVEKVTFEGIKYRKVAIRVNFDAVNRYYLMPLYQ
jgi:hypothetical protein